jgi:hypothetical protein
MVKKQYQSSFALSIVSNLLLNSLLIATNRMDRTSGPTERGSAACPLIPPPKCLYDSHEE